MSNKGVNMKNKIREYLEALDLWYGMFNIPTIKPHRLFISDESLKGNAWGKVVIEGRTWREIYETLQTIDLSANAFANRKMHEIPDNRKVCENG